MEPDLVERARALADAIGRGDISGFVTDATTYRHGRTLLNGWAWMEDVARRHAEGAAFETTELVQKRNVVFLGWRWGGREGTWVLSFDRDGRVAEWLEA